MKAKKLSVFVLALMLLLVSLVAVSATGNVSFNAVSKVTNITFPIPEIFINKSTADFYNDAGDLYYNFSINPNYNYYITGTVGNGFSFPDTNITINIPQSCIVNSPLQLKFEQIFGNNPYFMQCYDYIDNDYVLLSAIKTWQGIYENVSLVNFTVYPIIYTSNVTIHNPDGNGPTPQSFSNPENAFDNNMSSYAENIFTTLSTTSINRYLGQNYSELRYIENIYINYSQFSSGTFSTYTADLELYNGTAWVKHSTIKSTLLNNDFDGTINVRNSSYGYRIYFRLEIATSSSRTHTYRVYELNPLYADGPKGVVQFFNLNEGNYTVLVESPGYYQKTQDFEVLNLDNKIINVFDVFNNKHNVSLFWQNGSAVDYGLYNITVRNVANNFIEVYSGNSSISNKTTLELLQGLSYNITVDAVGFTSNSVLTPILSSNQTFQNINLIQTGFSNISVLVRNEANNNLMTQNVSMIIDRYTSTQTYTIVNGNFTEIVPLLNSSMRFVFSSTGFGTRQNVQTFEGNPQYYYDLDQLLLNTSNDNSETITFKVTDGTNKNIVTAQIKIEQLTESGTEVYEIKNTDIAGIATFILDITKTYLITISKDGFVTQTFFLDLATTSYTIVLDRGAVISFADGYEGIFFTVLPNPPKLNPTNVTFSINISASGSNLDTLQLRLVNKSNQFQTIATATFLNVGAGGVYNLTADLSGYNNSQVRLRVIYKVEDKDSITNVYDYLVYEFTPLTGSLEEMRQWAATNLSTNTRVVLLIALMILTFILMSIFIRGNINVIATMILTVAYAFALSLSMIIMAVFMVIIIFVAAMKLNQGGEL